jgi:outer membrane protein TolC
MAALLASLCAPSYGAAPGAAPAVNEAAMTLDIRRVLELVAERNSAVAAARRSVSVAEQGINTANAAKLPDINAALSVNYLGDITILDRDFTNATRAPMPHLGNSLELSLYQPVYSGGAITASVELAKSASRLSLNTLEQTRQTMGIQAVGCYLELFKASNLLGVYDENIAITEKLIAEMRARHQEGVVLKNDITRYELRLSTLKYDRLTLANRIAVLNHDLCVLLSLPEGTAITTDIDSDLRSLPLLQTKEHWRESSAQNSLALKALDIQKDMNLQRRKIIKAEYLPKVGLVAGDKLSGPIDFEIPVINNNYNFWYVGVNVQYSLSSLFKTPKSVRQNLLEYEEITAGKDAAADNLERAIDNSYTLYTQAYDMLATEEKNVELAAENYRVVENRYNNQLALLTDMLDASTAKLDADVRLVNARVNIIYYYYQLKYNSNTL